VLPAVLAVLALAPLALLVLGSLRRLGLPPPQGLELVPADPSLESYRALPAVVPVWTYLRNSVIVAAIAVPLAVVVSSLAGFAIRVASSRAKRAAVVATVAMLLVPVTAVWATRFEVYRLAHVTDTLVPLIAPALASPFLVLIYVWAFHRIPLAQLQVASLDGAGPWRMWWRVGLPQVRPATYAVAAIAFTFFWSDVIDPLLYVDSQSLQTLPLGLHFLKLLRPTDFPILLAGSVVATLPIVLVLLIAHRAFLSDRALPGGPG